MPEISDGFCRNCWKSPHSPWPTVAPNDAGCWSDMSNATAFALAIAPAVTRVVASGYTLVAIRLFPVAKPPFLAHAAAACGVARNFTNAWMAGVSRNATIVSPPITTDGPEPLIDGKVNSPKSLGFAFTVWTPGTKSPSITIAAFGGVWKTLFTDVGKSV